MNARGEYGKSRRPNIAGKIEVEHIKASLTRWLTSGDEATY